MTYTEKCAASAKLSNKTNCCTSKVVVVAVVVVVVVVVFFLGGGGANWTYFCSCFFTVSIVLHHFKFFLTSLYNNIKESFAFSPG